MRANPYQLLSGVVELRSGHRSWSTIEEEVRTSCEEFELLGEKNALGRKTGALVSLGTKTTI